MTAEDRRRWAEELAATLPPLTPTEAAELGGIAVQLDSRESRLGGEHRA